MNFGDMNLVLCQPGQHSDGCLNQETWCQWNWILAQPLRLGPSEKVHPFNHLAVSSRKDLMVFRKPQDNSYNSPPIWKSSPSSCSSCSSSPSIIEGRSLQNTIDHLMTIQQDMRTSMHGAGGGYGILWGQIKW